MKSDVVLATEIFWMQEVNNTFVFPCWVETQSSSTWGDSSQSALYVLEWDPSFPAGIFTCIMGEFITSCVVVSVTLTFLSHLSVSMVSLQVVL